MIYQSTSIESLISKILRDTKLTDSSAMNDMYEWIPEAMEMMQTKYELVPRYKDVDICFHYGKLPCGLSAINAVEYCGSRLGYSSSAKNPTTVNFSEQPVSQTIFRSIRGEQLNPETGDNIPFLGEQIESIMSLPQNSKEYYQLSMSTIMTSFETGKVRVHYMGIPLDDKGFPLIPDNANYREAIYYFVRAKLIGAGMFTDPIYGVEGCMALFEKYAGRAISEISWPTEDRMQEMVKNQVRLIKPVLYWESYGNVQEEGSYGY